MHVVTILRYYLGLTQMELAECSGVSYADVNEIENKPNSGLIEKYRKLAQYLHVPVHTIVMNDVLSVPETFFAQKSKVKYTDPPKKRPSRPFGGGVRISTGTGTAYADRSGTCTTCSAQVQDSRFPWL